MGCNARTPSELDPKADQYFPAKRLIFDDMKEFAAAKVH